MGILLRGDNTMTKRPQVGACLFERGCGVTESIPQGLKPALLQPRDAKAKALAYLEAKTVIRQILPKAHFVAVPRCQGDPKLKHWLPALAYLEAKTAIRQALPKAPFFMGDLRGG